MKVKELIEKLEEMGLEKEVRFGSVIESGRSWSGCNDGEVSLGSGSVLEEDEEGRMVVKLDDEGEEIVDENVVLLRVDGDEDWYE